MKIKGIENISVKVITALLAVLMLPIVVLSFPHRYENILMTIEAVYLFKDNPIVVFLLTCAFIAVVLGVTRLLRLIPEKTGRWLIPAAGAAVSLAIALYWVYSCKAAPQADQASAYWAAVMQYQSALGESSEFLTYIQTYQQQLGLVQLYMLLFKITGELSFFPLLVLNGLCVPVMLTALYAIVYKISRRYDCAVAALLLGLSCVPVYLYTSFAYGEIISTTFSMLAVLLAMTILEKYDRRFKDMKKNDKAVFVLEHVGCFACMFIAIQLRMNSLIVVIAIVAVTAVKAISKKRPAGLVLIACVAAGAILPGMISKAAFSEQLAGADGMPAALWVAMGMQEKDGLCGWNNYYNIATFYECGSDAELASERAKADIADRLGYFKNNPGQAVSFYMRKFESQWNCPLFQSVQMNSYIEGKPTNIAHGILYFEDIYYYVRDFANVHHSAVLVCALVGLIAGLYMKRRGIECYILSAAILGGMLFSLIWEAKARYCFPYYVFMLSLAAVGLCCMGDGLGKLFGNKKAKAGK